MGNAGPALVKSELNHQRLIVGIINVLHNFQVDLSNSGREASLWSKLLDQLLLGGDSKTCNRLQDKSYKKMENSTSSHCAKMK